MLCVESALGNSRIILFVHVWKKWKTQWSQRSYFVDPLTNEITCQEAQVRHRSKGSTPHEWWCCKVLRFYLFLFGTSWSAEAADRSPIDRTHHMSYASASSVLCPHQSSEHVTSDNTRETSITTFGSVFLMEILGGWRDGEISFAVTSTIHGTYFCGLHVMPSRELKLGNFCWYENAVKCV